MNVVDIATDQARRANAVRINRIDLEVGALAGVLVDSLEFCFTAARKGTLAAEAELKVDIIKARGRCQECSTEFTTETHLAVCPNCESFKIDLLSGQELKIKSINVD